MLGQEERLGLLIEPIKGDTWLHDMIVAQKTATMIDYEQKIDPRKTIYLFTWNPDREETPDCDFETQHEFWLDNVTLLLRGTAAGLACVETGALGYPHYHGWYQLSSNTNMEQCRLVAIKLMVRYGNLKITKSIGHYKIGSFVRQANCLAYYKKDMVDAMLYIRNNPITPYVKTVVEFEKHLWWFKSLKTDRCSIADLETKLTNKKFYEDFYKDSDPSYKK